jgi:hypothetical protein
VTAEEVLAEFDAWLAAWPECPAKWWVEENPPRTCQVIQAVREAVYA